MVTLWIEPLLTTSYYSGTKSTLGEDIIVMMFIIAASGPSFTRPHTMGSHSGNNKIYLTSAVAIAATAESLAINVKTKP